MVWLLEVVTKKIGGDDSVSKDQRSARTGEKVATFAITFKKLELRCTNVRLCSSVVEHFIRNEKVRGSKPRVGLLLPFLCPSTVSFPRLEPLSPRLELETHCFFLFEVSIELLRLDPRSLPIVHGGWYEILYRF